jgi:hypothetical protein
MPGRLSLLCCLLLFVACGRASKGILTEKEMEAVLTDMWKAEAWITLDPAVYRHDTSKAQVYQAVFHKHHISRETYDSSLVWYARHTDIYLQICEKVLARLDNEIHTHPAP